MPYVTVMWIVRVINESLGRLSMSHHSTGIVSKWVIVQLFVVENVIFA
jgi:hypothetical protein